MAKIIHVARITQIKNERNENIHIWEKSPNVEILLSQTIRDFP